MTQTRNVVFNHVVLKGSPYQIGEIQAGFIKNIPRFREFLKSGAGKLSADQYDRISSQMEKFNPGINEEIKGMADGMGISLEEMIYYSLSYMPRGHCSQFAVLASRTEEGRTLVGRSYEFGIETEDMRFCTIQAEKKYAFMGSSLLLFGFSEGMNEHGLVVSQTAGGLPVGAAESMRRPIDDGFMFWFVIRAVLEQCKTVDEAIELIKRIPACGNPILLVADKAGAAALVEVFGSHKAVKRIDAASQEQALASANHFSLPESSPYRDPVWKNSQVRYDLMCSLVNGNEKVNHQKIKRLLSDEYPNGLACHYYQEFFGTLRSMIFDPQAGKLEVCFGTPVGGTWMDMDFNTPMNSYPLELPLKKMTGDFMKVVD